MEILHCGIQLLHQVQYSNKKRDLEIKRQVCVKFQEDEIQGYVLREEKHLESFIQIPNTFTIHHLICNTVAYLHTTQKGWASR